jgi:recombination protein RecT
MTKAENAEHQNQPAVVQKAASEKFTVAVMKEFSSNVGELSLTSFQKRLIQNYFIKLDRTLKEAEIKRIQKGQNADQTPLNWNNVNMPKLAQDVVALSLVGLDPLQSNHINMIPYKNNSTGLYDITPLIGYRGMELKAKKYGLDIPDDVIIELVYKNDNFKEIKKSSTNKIETYEFEIVNSFDRGELVGGFYYLNFFNNPEKNKIRVFNKAQIEKRKPKYASPEFWGGEKKKYNSQEKEKVEGWYDEMAYKTISRAAYNSITIDSEKIDDHFAHIIGIEEQERNLKEIETPIDVMRAEVKAETVSQTVNFEEVPNSFKTIEIGKQKPVEEIPNVIATDTKKGSKTLAEKIEEAKENGTYQAKDNPNAGMEPQLNF